MHHRAGDIISTIVGVVVTLGCLTITIVIGTLAIRALIHILWQLGN